MQTAQEKNRQTTGHKESTPQSALLVVEREFEVPVSQLFTAFTTPEEIKAWWWPKGLYADQVELDFHDGGHYFINMKGFAQGGGGMVGHFEEIIENKRISMTDQFADKDGNVITPQQAQMKGEWPEFVYITFDFETRGDNGSLVRLSQQGIPDESQADCIQGWNEMFDKLETHLGGTRQ